MRRLLLASVAAAGLALAAPAWAQTPEPVPSPPPVTTPTPDPDVTPDEEHGTMGAQEQEGPAAVEPSSQTDPLASPTASPAPAMPAAVSAEAPVTASDVCAPRTTEVSFGRSSALGRDNSNTIERAVDAASVCSLQQVVIAQSGDGAAANRRSNAVRALLVRQGVPADLIQVQSASDTEANEVELRMTFAGVARGSGAPAQPAAQPAPTIEPQSDAPDADMDDTPQEEVQPPPDT